MSESTPEQPDEPKRTSVARAFAASVRKPGEKKGTSSYLVTAGVAVVLAGAVALGVGAIVFHHAKPAKTVNAADRRRSPGMSTPMTPPAKPPPASPVPGPGAKVSPGSPGKSGKGKDSARRSTNDGSSGNSPGAGVRAAAVPGHLLVSYASRRCIDVTDGRTSNGTPLQIWDCSGAPRQQWSAVNGTLQSLGMCMTLNGPSANGTPVVLSHCNGSTSQRFRLVDAQDIVHSGTNECLDVRDLQSGNGARLQVWKCAGTSNQKWHT